MQVSRFYLILPSTRAAPPKLAYQVIFHISCPLALSGADQITFPKNDARVCFCSNSSLIEYSDPMFLAKFANDNLPFKDAISLPAIVPAAKSNLGRVNH